MVDPCHDGVLKGWASGKGWGWWRRGAARVGQLPAPPRRGGAALP